MSDGEQCLGFGFVSLKTEGSGDGIPSSDRLPKRPLRDWIAARLVSVAESIGSQTYYGRDKY